MAAEDSGANQADGDETDHRDGGDADEQDTFSAEGHDGEAFGRDVSGQGVLRHQECDDSGMRRRKTPTGECGEASPAGLKDAAGWVRRRARCVCRPDLRA